MASVKTSSGKVLATALAFSALVHTVAIYPQSLDYASRPFRRAAAAISDSYHAYKIRKDRQKLVEGAREQMKKGKLRLGEFILKGNEIDAREHGENLNLEGTRRLYESYEASLAYEISSGRRLPVVFPEVFKDMKYYGIPGGRMADALLDKGGSCDQLSQLSSALIHDLGFPKQAFLRAYGANEDGIGHIAPIFKGRGVEYDVVAGGQSDGKGTLFPATYLVEAYAKAHGLPFSEFQDNAGGGRGGPVATRAIGSHEISLPGGKPSGFAYPRAKDSFGGGAPLYSSKAFHAYTGQKPGIEGTGARGAGSTGKKGDEQEMPAVIEFEPGLYIGLRSVAGVAEHPDDEMLQAQVVELPTEEKLNGISRQIEIGKKSLKEGSLPSDNWDLAVRYGAISGLYRELEWNLRLLGKETLAEAAYEQRKKIAKLAEKPLALLHDSKVLVPPEYDPQRDSHGYLVYLGTKGEDALLRALEKRPKAEWMDGHRWFHCEAAAYLVANRSSRERSLKLLGGFTGEEKAHVLEVLKDVELEGEEEFFKALRAFSSLARRLGNAGPSNLEAIGGVMNQGESLNYNEFGIRLDDIETSGKESGAVISIFNSEKKTVYRNKLKEGDRVTISIGGREFDLKADKVAPGYTHGARWAHLKVFAGAGTGFQSMVSEIRKECGQKGIGHEWEDAIIAACATRRKNYPYVYNNRVFFVQLHEWLESRGKGFERLKKDIERHLDVLKREAGDWQKLQESQ